MDSVVKTLESEDKQLQLGVVKGGPMEGLNGVSVVRVTYRIDYFNSSV